MTTEPANPDAVWRAVDRLTQSQRREVGRRLEDGAWLDELAAQDGGACNIRSYRAATARWATIPSLWDQATAALVGGEIGGSGSKPLRERSPADLDLMEIRAIIRDMTRHELHARGHKTAKGPDGLDVPFDPSEIRTLASLAIQKDGPEQMWWWEYRFDQWGRLLENYLHAAEHVAKPVHLRNTACPLCAARQVVSDDEGDDGRKVVPALVVDFSQDGYVRAAECLACGAAWFRGEQLEELAEQVGA
jgi:hypothetical protein